MKLYRNKHRNPETGERKTWGPYWVRATVQGKRLRKSTGCRDRKAAERVARALVSEAELAAVGGRDSYLEHQRRPLSEHVDDFEVVLRSKGSTEAHVRERMEHLRAFVEDAEAKHLGCLDSVSAAKWLAKVRRRGLSARSHNKRHQALRQFGRWLVAEPLALCQ